MQALVRVQARVRARRVRMSEEGQAVQKQLCERRQLESRPRKSLVCLLRFIDSLAEIILQRSALV